MRSERGSAGYGFIALCAVGFIAVLLILSSVIGALVPDSTAVDAATNAGFHNVQILSKTVWLTQFGCGQDDEVRFTVRGVDASGYTREFYVCAGVLKGGTVRSK